MRIFIKSNEGKPINIIIPTRLIFNSLTAKIGAYAISKNTNAKIKSKDIGRFIKETHRMKRKYPNLELINVESSDGDSVKIKL